MRLFIFRHGNTFGPGDPVVMCGARTDLPLVARGRAQAKAAGDCLIRLGVKPGRVISGPLIRTRAFLEIALQTADLPNRIEIDDRLTEIDYGAWEGLTDEDCIALSGAAALAAWNTRSEVPAGITFSPSPQIIAQNLLHLATELAAHSGTEEDLVLCSSNGIMRSFLRLIPGAMEQALADKSFKVKTGHVCVIKFAGNAWHILAWNESPETLVL